MKLEEKQGKLDGSESEKEENTADEVKKKVERGKRKSFDELKSSKMKKARVDDIIQVIKADVDLENHVIEQLMAEKEKKKKEKEEAFKICCLNLMKTLSLSDTKYDDRGKQTLFCTMRAQCNRYSCPLNVSNICEFYLIGDQEG